MSLDKKTLFRAYFLVVLLASAIAAWRLLSIPAEAGGIFFGYSPSRVALLAAVLLVLFAGLWGLLKVSRDGKWADVVVGFIRAKKWAIPASIFLGALLFLSGSYFFLTPALADGLGGYYPRLAPVVGLLTAIGGSTLLALALLFGDWSRAGAWKRTFSAGIYPAVILAILSLIIAWGKLGLTPDIVWWAAPGTPVLMAQAFIVWLAALVFILLSPHLDRLLSYSQNRIAQDALLCALIWLAAVWAWLPVPVTSDHFITPFFPPNSEFYPFSDAATYAGGAQRLLVGDGLSSESASKPAYSLFLAVLHILVGQGYEDVANLQSILLGVIPVLMYLLAARLGGRAAGLIAAGIVIVRERNALELTKVVEASHSKMFMTDTPTLAFVLALALVTVYWLEKPRQRTVLPLLLGGMLGWGTLLRGQVLVLMPMVLLASLIVLWRNRSSWLKTSLLVGVGGLLFLAPWLWRGFQHSRQVSLRETLPRTFMLATKYSLTPEQRQSPLPGESAEAFDARMQQQVIQFVLDRPDYVAGFISAHFFHSQIESVLYLPQSLTIESPQAYVERVPFWDEDWTGAFPAETGIVLALNLGLIAFGLGASWERHRARIFVPILISVGYVLSVSVARFSGWRFILPADWLTNLFFSIGLAQLTLMGVSIFSPRFRLDEAVTPEKMGNAAADRISWKAFGLVAACLLLAGSIFPVAEALFPRRYSSLSRQEALEMYRTALSSETFGDAPSLEMLDTFLGQEGAQVVYGRGLYPRYLRDGVGFGGNNPVYSPAPYSRLVLQMVGAYDGLVELPLLNAPGYVPNAADVLVFGCAREGVVDALVIVVTMDGETSILARSPWTEPACPFPSP
ncbi:MAG: glycosyltransferase family 39 protein [Chloroflexota bacterium]